MPTRIVLSSVSCPATIIGEEARPVFSQHAVDSRHGSPACLERPDGDVIVAVKAVYQARGATSIEFLEVFVVAPKGTTLLVKQQACNESTFVR